MKFFFTFSLLLSLLINNAAFGQSSEGSNSGPEEKDKESTAKMSKEELLSWKNEDLTWGEFDPGKGVSLSKSEIGSIALSFYALGRYINQLPADQTYNDHLGRQQTVAARSNIELHRVIVWLKGFAYDPKFQYSINFWTVNSTKNIYTIGSLVYKFAPEFELQVGIEGNPGVRSLNGQHPYFLGTDRHMGDEFFKPGFTMGLVTRGRINEKYFYRLMAGNSSSEIGILTSDFDRKFTTGGSLWYLSTGEFGPRAGYGDYELHQKLAIRTGVSFTQSTEQAFTKIYEGDDPKNVQLKLSDGLNLFSPGALAPGLLVTQADYKILSPDFAIKYDGFFFDVNYYFRWLDNFQTRGNAPTPMSEIFDHGFMIQIADQVKPQKLELYTAYTYIWGEFNNPWEIALGANYYPEKTRNWRLNGMINHIEQSPVGSQFGFYSAGQTGETIILATDVFF